jgi:hypothetical protein
VVDGCRQASKEPPEGRRIGGVEGRAAQRADLVRGVPQALGVAAGDDDVGPSARARRAVSSPMPELPPSARTVCPGSSGSRFKVEIADAVV